MSLDNWLEIIVALTAIYAAFLSTLNYLMRRRSTRPQLEIDLVEESYTERQDSYGQIHRGPVRSRQTLTRTSTQTIVDVLRVSAKNTGQIDIVLRSWGIQFHDGRTMFSEEVREAEAILQPRRSIDKELRFQKVRDLPLDSPRRVRYLVGFYEDTLGNVYKSRRVKPSRDLKKIVETHSRAMDPSIS